MRKLICIFCSLLSLTFSQEFYCIYRVEGEEENFFQSVLVEIIHDTIRGKFQEVFSGIQVETSPLIERFSDESAINYLYHIQVPIEGEEAKLIFEYLFKDVKSKVLNFELSNLKAFVFNEIKRKIGDKSFEYKEKVLLKLNQYLEAFTEEKKAEFLEKIEGILTPKPTLLPALYEELEIEPANDKRIHYVLYEEPQFIISASERDKKIINKIISDMGSKSLLSLLKKRGEMLRLGDEIRHVPPMDFLAVIFTQPELRHHMATIKKSYLKWANIVDEVGSNMNKESKLPGFEDKIKAFAKFLGADSSVLLKKAHEKDWSGFVSALF